MVIVDTNVNLFIESTKLMKAHGHLLWKGNVIRVAISMDSCAQELIFPDVKRDSYSAKKTVLCTSLFMSFPPPMNLIGSSFIVTGGALFTFFLSFVFIFLTAVDLDGVDNDVVSR